MLRRIFRPNGQESAQYAIMNDTAESITITLKEQLDYYRARASEYDEWWLRQGRYDRGTNLNSLWFEDATVIKLALREFKPGGRILELACGTGIWTEELLPFASSMTCVDGSSEMLAITENRVQSSRVNLVRADLFSWEPCGQFDLIFFGFWLSHVPPSRFKAFWQSVSASLSPGGRVFFVDSRDEHTSSATDHHLPSPASTTLRRRLNDGNEYQIYKVFYEPSELASRLRTLGWTFEVSQTALYFIYGRGHRTDEAESSR